MSNMSLAAALSSGSDAFRIEGEDYDEDEERFNMMLVPVKGEGTISSSKPQMLLSRQPSIRRGLTDLCRSGVQTLSSSLHQTKSHHGTGKADGNDTDGKLLQLQRSISNLAVACASLHNAASKHKSARDGDLYNFLSASFSEGEFSMSDDTSVNSFFEEDDDDDENAREDNETKQEQEQGQEDGSKESEKGTEKKDRPPSAPKRNGTRPARKDSDPSRKGVAYTCAAFQKNDADAWDMIRDEWRYGGIDLRSDHIPSRRDLAVDSVLGDNRTSPESNASTACDPYIELNITKLQQKVPFPMNDDSEATKAPVPIRRIRSMVQLQENIPDEMTLKDRSGRGTRRTSSRRDFTRSRSPMKRRHSDRPVLRQPPMRCDSSALAALASADRNRGSPIKRCNSSALVALASSKTSRNGEDVARTSPQRLYSSKMELACMRRSASGRSIVDYSEAMKAGRARAIRSRSQSPPRREYSSTDELALMRRHAAKSSTTNATMSSRDWSSSPTAVSTPKHSNRSGDTLCPSRTEPLPMLPRHSDRQLRPRARNAGRADSKRQGRVPQRSRSSMDDFVSMRWAPDTKSSTAPLMPPKRPGSLEDRAPVPKMPCKSTSRSSYILRRSGSSVDDLASLRWASDTKASSGTLMPPKRPAANLDVPMIPSRSRSRSVKPARSTMKRVQSADSDLVSMRNSVCTSRTKDARRPQRRSIREDGNIKEGSKGDRWSPMTHCKTGSTKPTKSAMKRVPSVDNDLMSMQRTLSACLADEVLCPPRRRSPVRISSFDVDTTKDVDIDERPEDNQTRIGHKSDQHALELLCDDLFHRRWTTTLIDHHPRQQDEVTRHRRHEGDCAL